MKLFLLSLLVASAASIELSQAGECPSNGKDVFNSYLSCLDHQFNVVADPQTFEQELLDDAKQSTQACFTNSVNNVQSSGKCFINQNTLNVQQFAFKPHGPLATCPICLQFAKVAVDAIINADKSKSECVRKIVYPAIARESIDCIKKSVPDFNSEITVPDFERIVSLSPKIILDTVAIELMQQIAISNCAKRDNERALSTAKCLSNPPVTGFRSKHCAAIDACVNGVSPGCQNQLNVVSPVTCSCFKSSGQELQSRLANITTVLGSLASTVRRGNVFSRHQIEGCIDTFKDNMKTPANDWHKVIQESLTTCSLTRVSLDQLLRGFCVTIFKEHTKKPVNDDLQVALMFLSGLVDSLGARVARFCPGDSCQQQKLQQQ